MKTAKRLLSPPRLSFTRLKSTETRRHTQSWSDIVKADPKLENTFLTQCLASSLRPEFKSSSFSCRRGSRIRAIGSTRHASFQTSVTGPKNNKATPTPPAVLKIGEIQKLTKKNVAKPQQTGVIDVTRERSEYKKRGKAPKKFVSRTPILPPRKINARDIDKPQKSEIYCLYKKLQERWPSWPLDEKNQSQEDASTSRSTVVSISKYLEEKKKKPDVSVLASKLGVRKSALNVFKSDKNSKSSFFEELRKRNDAIVSRENSENYLQLASKTGSSKPQFTPKFTPATNNQHLAISSKANYKERTKLPAGFERSLGITKKKSSPLQETVNNYFSSFKSKKDVNKEPTQKMVASTEKKTAAASVRGPVMNPDVQAIRRKMKRNVEAMQLQPQVYPRGSLSMSTTHLPIEPCRRIVQTTGGREGGGGGNRSRGDSGNVMASLSSQQPIEKKRDVADGRPMLSSVTNVVINKLKSMFTSLFRDK